MTEINETALKALRVPFPAESVGLLPKQYKRNTPESEKKHCDVCGAFVGPHLHLDFVGHGPVTDRLLSADPTWSWEPYDMGGEPALRRSVNQAGWVLWIKLTVGGVTRIGVGSVESDVSDIEKQLIGDAIRNASMRFGVALDLWSNKAELESLIGNQTVATRRRKPPSGSTATPTAKTSSAPPRVGGAMDARDRNKLKAFFARLTPPLTAEGDILLYLSALDALAGRTEPLGHLSDLTAEEGNAILSELDVG